MTHSQQLPLELIEELENKFLNRANNQQLRYEITNYIIEWAVRNNVVLNVKEEADNICDHPINTGGWKREHASRESEIYNSRSDRTGEEN